MVGAACRYGRRGRRSKKSSAVSAQPADFVRNVTNSCVASPGAGDKRHADLNSGRRMPDARRSMTTARMLLVALSDAKNSCAVYARCRLTWRTMICG